MAKTMTTIDDVWAGFQTLSAPMRDRFLDLLLQDHLTRQELEDRLDLEIVNDRLDEPTRPLDEVLREIGR